MASQPAGARPGIPPGPGRDARSPGQMPPRAWWAVLKRTFNEGTRDNVSLIAAGVAFYGFLAIVPMLGAVVLTYGLVARVDTVVDHMAAVTRLLPAEAASLIGDQLISLVRSSQEKKGVGLLVALLIALYGAMRGAGAIVTALNIAYEQQERRSIVRFYGVVLAITIAAVVMAVIGLFAVALLGYLQSWLPQLPDSLAFVSTLVTYGLLLLVATTGAAALYRYGPDRRDAKWRWLTPGSALASLLWVGLTAGFGVYVANFGNFDATYGSLGAIVAFLTWLYLSAYILIMGAELNAELEHQTAQDTTIGPDKPMGERDATMADTVAPR